MDKLTIFIAITASAVVLQMLILLGMYLAVRKLAASLQTATDETQSRLLPLLEKAKVLQQDVHSMLEISRPKIDVTLDNVAHVTTTARADIERVQVTLNDTLDRLRLQVIRGDEMITHAMDRVEQTSEKVHRSVTTPVRKVSGMAAAISTGVGTFFNAQKRRRNGGPSDEMFI